VRPLQRALGALQCGSIFAVCRNNHRHPHHGIRHVGTGVEWPWQSAPLSLRFGSTLNNFTHSNIALVERRDLGLDVGKRMERRTGLLGRTNGDTRLGGGCCGEAISRSRWITRFADWTKVTGHSSLSCTWVSISSASWSKQVVMLSTSLWSWDEANVAQNNERVRRNGRKSVRLSISL